MGKSYKKEIIKLRKENKSYNEIVDILGCSKSTVSYHCNNEGLGEPDNGCLKLTEEIKSNVKDFYKKNTVKETIKLISNKYNIDVSKTTLRTHLGKKTGEVLSEKERKRRKVIAVTKRRKKLREMAIEFLGGKCSKCGYNKCVDALETHHVNPEEKEFSLSLRGMTRSWEKIKEELKKCILVCANCHREIHYEFNKN